MGKNPTRLILLCSLADCELVWRNSSFVGRWLLLQHQPAAAPAPRPAPVAGHASHLTRLTSHVTHHTSRVTYHTSLASHASSHITFSAENSALFVHCFDCVARDTPPGPKSDSRLQTDDEAITSVGVGGGETVVPVFTWYVHLHMLHTCAHVTAAVGAAAAAAGGGVGAALSQPTPSLVTDGDA